MLQPKRTNFRKQFKGRIHGVAKGGTDLNFGQFGLKAMEPERVTARQIEAAVAVNEQARLGTLKLGLLLLAGISAVAILPASRLPRYKPEEIPDPSPAGGSD